MLFDITSGFKIKLALSSSYTNLHPSVNSIHLSLNLFPINYQWSSSHIPVFIAIQDILDGLIDFINDIYSPCREDSYKMSVYLLR